MLARFENFFYNYNIGIASGPREEWEVLSIYQDDNGKIWIDIQEKEEDKNKNEVSKL